jgi:Protein of unknown function (DUF2470)/Domain of unknown function (DUF4499)
MEFSLEANDTTFMGILLNFSSAAILTFKFWRERRQNGKKGGFYIYFISLFFSFLHHTAHSSFKKRGMVRENTVHKRTILTKSPYFLAFSTRTPVLPAPSLRFTITMTKTSNTETATTETTTATSTTVSGDEISTVVSQRICQHMNDDHAVTVFGMAQTRLFLVSPCINGDGRGTKITSAKMTKVTNDGCEIKVVKCHGDLCEMETVVYPFAKRCTTSAEIKQELIVIHSHVLQPNFLWLILKPRCVAIIALDVLLFLGTFLLHMRNGMVEGLFWFLVVAHLVEGSVGVYYCRRILKVNWKTTKQWLVCILPVGLPVMRELKELCAMAGKQSSSSSSSNGSSSSSKKLS